MADTPHLIPPDHGGPDASGSEFLSSVKALAGILVFWSDSNQKEKKRKNEFKKKNQQWRAFKTQGI